MENTKDVKDAAVIVIRFDREMKVVQFNLENCSHVEAQRVVLSVAMENHKLMLEEMEVKKDDDI